ncbi:MAG: bifunctional acetate--CoA ligase family protein/GNAT family N-acetyltransferase [Chloroflexi bacterium]|nr:bifunctional acetate--CoA ligase family protein/GNAT family N-acetyltransferase [Chloroflexota bacterium]
MDIHKLDCLLKPQRIALIGITTNPNSVGGKVLINLISGGFRGVVYPVNPDHEAVMGIHCFPGVSSLPKVPDVAVICNAAELVPGVVRECGEAGIKGLIILSAGFKETGAEGKALEAQIKAEASRFKDMRILGPNCLGIIVPNSRLNISFAPGMPRPGNIAFISQSGALCTSILDWANEGKIGFSYFVSVGNALDIDFGDLIDYFGEDEQTHSIILYVESISNARKFMAAARSFARNKPILVYKAGRFLESAEAAASHTGAMASEDAVYDAAFKRIGLARVYDIGEIFNCAELIGRNKTPQGPNLGIVTNAGGPGVMATDALIAAKGKLAPLSEQTLARLNEQLPPIWSHRNPVDVIGDARPKRIAKAAETVLQDPSVDALLVILTPQAMTNPTGTAREIGELAQGTPKPILAAWLGGESMREGMRLLYDAGVAAYQTPEQAVRAFMTLVSYARNLEDLYETPKDIPVEFTLDREKLRGEFNQVLLSGEKVLSEQVSKTVLAAHGIPATQLIPAKTPEQAVLAAGQIGYPVVVKIWSPDISHKTDAGGVALNLINAEMVQEAFTRVIENACAKFPRARVEGVTVQPMLNASDAVEMILGIKQDPVFGDVILVGAGGIYTELYNDRALGFPPLNEHLARRMLESLKIWPLLNGYRGKPALNVDKLVETMIRLSYLAADYPEILELDVNPLLVTPNAVVALDARIVVDGESAGKPHQPYGHLALHPYPEEYVRKVTLSDGAEVTLRPIKPEDEPLWLEMLGSCSQESLYSRFRYAFHWNSHDVATRYCYVDYDREIAIVIEHLEGEKRSLLGVGRLIADPDHETVEFAVLIIDAWQQRELGSIVTDYCLEIAKKWKINRLVAQTTTDNHRMVAVFRKRGFKIEIDPSTSEVFVEKELFGN